MTTVPKPSSDINITPMIDVLLVLLVIFMAALPLTQRSLDIVLPSNTQPPDARPPDASIVAEIGPARDISINRQPVERADLEARLRAIFDARHDKTLYIIGDSSLPYADVIDLIDSAKGAGVERVGVITEGMRRAANRGLTPDG